MTQKSAFDAEEWSRVVEAPLLAAVAVIGADRGGTLRETASLAQAYGDARRQGGGTELMDALVASPPTLDPARFRNPDEVRDQAPQRLRDAVSLLAAKATAEEVEEYRTFVLALAETVARAHKEGGFLGLGGKEISEAEQAALDQIAAALRAG